MKRIVVIEKLSAIREDLLALKASVTDVKKLADLVRQKFPTMWRNYQELEPYMTLEQKSRPHPIGAFDTFAENYLAVFQHGRAEDAVVLRTCKEHLTNAVTRFVPLMIADLDDLAKNLKAIT